MPHRITTIHTIRKLLFLLAMFSIVVLAAFSPVFSQNVEAQYICRITGAGIGTEWDCGPAGNASGTPFPDEPTCKAYCDTQGGFGVSANCITPIPSGVECGNNISDTGTFTDKDGNNKGTTIGGIAAGVVLGALVEILKFINSMLVQLVALVAQLLDAAITLSLAGLSGIGAITIGWGITRDISNLFFIFILLVISIATILRFEQYGAKQLLVRLIIIALLINFSLVIAATVVDISNVFALAFIGEIHPVSDHIAAILMINKLTDTKRPPLEVEGADTDWELVVSKGWLEGMDTLNHGFTTDQDVLSAAPATQNVFSGQSVEFFWQATILVLQLTLIFVFVALSAMLLIRSVALIIIFVLAPLGFLAAILPATRGLANQWWRKLFEWSFFFPMSAFMIYLAITYGTQMSQIFGAGSGSHVINTGVLFNYFVTVALLIGSLIVAKQMGIMGAAAAIGIGLGIAKRARGYAGRTSLRYVAAPIAAGVTGITGGLGRIPYVGRGLRYALAPITAGASAVQRAGVGVREQRYEAIKKRVTESASANRATLNALVTPAEQATFTEALIDKGQGQVLNERERRQAVTRFKREGDLGKLRKIYAFDPSLAAEGEETPAQQAAAVSRATEGISADDIRTKTNPAAVRNAFVADAIILNYGMQKLEAAAERSGEQLAPALRGAFERLREKNLDKILEGTGRTRATATADDNRNAYDGAIKQLNKENPDVLKFINRSQTINMEPAAPGTLNLADTIRTGVKTMNDAAEQEAEDALRNREAARSRTTPISAQEIAQARKGARKIDI